MSDLFAFGLEPQHSSAEEDGESEDGDESAESDPDWPECADCSVASYEVRQRVGQSVPLCPSCFADREGLQ